MSSGENGSATPSGNPPAESQPAARGFWGLLRNATVITAVVGTLGTASVSALQYVSGYNDSVAKLAKQDLENATSRLTEAVTALSNPLSLQERLFWLYSVARKDNGDIDDDAYEAKTARIISKSYEDSVAAVSAGINLLARKIEIDVDLPADLNHAAANIRSANSEPISATSLRDYQFNCNDHMPTFGNDKSGKDPSIVQLPFEGQLPLIIHWKNAKDNLLTLEYCFEHTHKKMEEIRRWASGSLDEKLQSSTPTKSTDAKLLKTLLKNQERRFHYFMGVATFKIEQFRVRYQPNGSFALCWV